MQFREESKAAEQSKKKIAGIGAAALISTGM